MLSVSPWKAITLQLICLLGLAIAFWIPNHIYSLDLITHPSQTLRMISFIRCFWLQYSFYFTVTFDTIGTNALTSKL
uniref:Uncharacterized protein n=1 Tax=Solanum lycopersicum TaxID=4081 RepID=A0A3Q7FTD1_SOLLC